MAGFIAIDYLLIGQSMKQFLIAGLKLVRAFLNHLGKISFCHGNLHYIVEIFFNSRQRHATDIFQKADYC
jgi:hypothetical protein